MEPAAHRDADDHVAALAHQSRQAGALGAEHEADAFDGEVADVEQAAVGVVVEADHPDAGVLDARQRCGQTADERHRHVLDGAGGGLGRRSGVMCTARWRGSTTPCDAGAVAAAQQRTEVARIGDAVDGDQERGADRADA